MQPWRPYCFITGTGRVIDMTRHLTLSVQLEVTMTTTLIIERLMACQR
jgi:hypothetical protein